MIHKKYNYETLVAPAPELRNDEPLSTFEIVDMKIAEAIKNKIPYCCPVCKGKKVVPARFYNVGNCEHSIFTPEPCRTCNSTGIVWSY